MSDFDFGAMAREAKQKADAAKAIIDRDAEQTVALEKARLERADTFINDRVLPIASSAKIAFEAEGVGVSISQQQSYTASPPHKIVATLAFKCFSLDDPQGARLNQSSKAIARFEHDGDRLLVSADDLGGGSSYRRAIDGDDQIAAAIRAALDQHLAEFAKRR